MPTTRRKIMQSAFAAAAVTLASDAGAQTQPATRAASRPSTRRAATTRSKNDRLRIGVIGCGGIARWHGRYLHQHGDIVALADVDKNMLASYNKDHAAGKAFAAEDYRAVLDRDDVDFILLATPDHWHAKIAVDTLRAGKDLYCEKPLTLTIDEGRIVGRVVRETGRVVQVGTQQRSEPPFVTAVGLVHGGRLGKIRRVIITLGVDDRPGKDFPKTPPPPELNWDMWLGQAPKVDYIKQRSHFSFRWWYEYSGGRMTDWGAHHMDIAQLAVAPDLPGPTIVEPLAVTHPVPLKGGWPTVDNSYNSAETFNVRCAFANGVEVFITDKHESTQSANNGILFEGELGSIFVNRDKLTGDAVDALKDNPLLPGVARELRAEPQQPHEKHVANFVDCVRSRQMPVSDVWSHHVTLTTCHLANIANRLGRKLQWDATKQEITGDAEANSFQARPQRKGYEVV